MRFDDYKNDSELKYASRSNAADLHVPHPIFQRNSRYSFDHWYDHHQYTFYSNNPVGRSESKYDNGGFIPSSQFEFVREQERNLNGLSVIWKQIIMLISKI